MTVFEKKGNMLVLYQVFSQWQLLLQDKEE
jgi:hypothetical protein